MFKFALVLVLLVFASGAAYYIGFDHGWEGAILKQTSMENAAMLATPDQKPTYEWQIEITGLDSGYAPTSTVSLMVDGVLHSIGIYNLSCNEQMVGELDPNQLSRVICWWGGGGHELGIFEEDGTYVVKQGDVDEGSSEIKGFRGNFKTLLTL